MKNRYLLLLPFILGISISNCTSILPNTKINSTNKNLIKDIPEYIYKNNGNIIKKSEILPNKIHLKIDTSLINNIIADFKVDKKVLNFIENNDSFKIKSNNQPTRKSNVLGNHITNSNHILANDKNIFNPNDLASLGGLIPVEYGEIITKNSSVGSASVNNSKSIFSSNLVTAKILAPIEENIQKVLTRYKAELLSRNDNNGTVITIKPDLKYVDLSTLENNILKVNSNSPVIVNDISFSSINTAKTIAVFFDMIANSNDITSNIGLEYNFLGQSAISPQGYKIVTDEAQEGAFNFYNNNGISKNINVPHTSLESYWINSSNIDIAWNYSLGQNTKVAVIDSDFDQIYTSFNENAINNLNRTVEYANKNTNTEIPDLDKYKFMFTLCPSRLNDLSNASTIFLNSDTYCNPFRIGKKGHGAQIASILFNKIDEKKSISGIIPRAKFVPLGFSGLPDGNINPLQVSFFTSKLEDIQNYNNDKSKEDGISVINLSITAKVGYLAKIGEVSDCIKINTKEGNDVTCDPNLEKISKLINELSNTKSSSSYNPNKISTIFVNSAGNQGIDIDNTILYPLSLKNVIGVGAYEIENDKKIRADFNPKDNVISQTSEISSNYGSTIDTWAPGDNIPFLDPDTNKWEAIKGTSFSSPISSGVISQLKSIRPDLTVGQIAEILHNSGELVTDSSFLTSANTGQRFLDAKGAIEYLLQNSPSDTIKRGKAEYFTGTYLSSGKFKIESIAPSKTVDITPNYPEYYKDLIGKKVIMSAWKINDNKYDVLQMREYVESTTFNTKEVKIAYPELGIKTIPGDSIAVEIEPNIKDLLKSISVVGNKTEAGLSLLGFVDKYAVVGIPSNILSDPELSKAIGNQLSDILLRSKNITVENPTGDPIRLLSKALYLTATSIGLNPTYPDGYPPTSKLPWVEFNKTIDVRKGEIYNLPMLNLGSKPTITAKNVNFIFKSYDSSKVTIEVPKNAEYGIQDVNVNVDGANYVFPNAINVLEDKTTAINGVSTVKDSNGNNESSSRNRNTNNCSSCRQNSSIINTIII
ncbi:MAG: S8/S53 family peptidase [Candidatus Sericytochromatia bacterium]